MKKYLITTFLLFSLASPAFSYAEKGWSYYMQGDFTGAINYCNGCLERSDCPDKDEALFISGESYASSKDFVRARESFRGVYKKYPGSIYASQAILRVADCYFLEGDYENAEEIYTYFVETNPQSAFLPVALLKLTYTKRKLGKWPIVKQYADILNSKFPGSFEAKEAKVLADAETYFTIQVGAFGEKNNALSLMRKLQVDGFEPYITEGKFDGRTIYKVRVGKIDQRRDAEQVYQRLVNNNYPAQIYP